jgi:hypothetical protein
MGKAKKLKHLKSMRNVPLEQQIREENCVKSNDKKKVKINDFEETKEKV